MKTIITILIILMIAQTAFAQQCTIPAAIDVTFNNDATGQFSDTHNPGEEGNYERPEVFPESVSVTVNSQTIDWDENCDPEKIETPYLGFDWYTDAGFTTDDAYKGKAEVTQPIDDKPVMYYVYSDDTGGIFKVIAVSTDGTITGKEYTHDTNDLSATSITTNADGSAAYIAGKYMIGGNSDALVMKINSDLSVAWAYRYDLGDYSVFNDIKYDAASSSLAALGRSEQVELAKWHTLVTLNLNGNLILDFLQITSDQEEATYNSQQLELKPVLNDDTIAYVVVEDEDFEGFNDVLYGSFSIDKDTSIFSAAYTPRFLGNSNAAFEGYSLTDAQLSNDGDLEMTLSYTENGDPDIYYCAAARTNGATGAVEIIRGIAVEYSGCSFLSIANGNTYFASDPSLIVSFNADNTLTLKNLQKVAEELYPVQMTYGNDKYYLSYMSENWVPGIVEINSDLATVEGAIALPMQDDIATYPYSTFYHPEVSMLLLARNQGGGFQNFGITSPIDGPVPEFSLTTLLLATLLAGGLVLFVVRRRK